MQWATARQRRQQQRGCVGSIDGTRMVASVMETEEMVKMVMVEATVLEVSLDNSDGSHEGGDDGDGSAGDGDQEV